MQISKYLPFTLFWVKILFGIVPSICAQSNTDSLAASTWAQQGTLLAERYQYEEALKAYQQAADGFERAGRWRLCTQNLVKVGSIQFKMVQKPATARTVAKGLQLVEERLNGLDLSKPQLIGLKALLLSEQQQHDSAQMLLRESIQYLEQHYPEKTALIAQSYSDLGWVVQRSGNLKGALPHYQRAISQYKGLDTESARTEAAMALYRLGLTLKGLGQYEEAQQYESEALDLFEQKGDKEGQARALYGLGDLMMISGNYERALEFLQKSEGIYKAIYGPEHIKVAETLSLQGTIYTALEQLDLAERAYQNALAIARRTLGDGDYSVLLMMRNLGTAYHHMGKLDQAFHYLLTAQPLFERLLPKPHPQKALLYTDLSYLYLEHGVHIDSALFFAQRLYEDGLILFGPHHPAIYDALSAMSTCATQQGNLDDALQYAQKSLSALCYTFDNPDILQNPQPEDFSILASSISAFGQKITVLFSRWKKTRQSSDFQAILACLDAGEAAIHQLETNEQTLSDYGLAGVNYDFLKLAIRCAYAYYLAYPTSANLEQCHRWMEAAKAQKLLQAAQESEAKAFAGVPDALLEQEATLAGAINYAEENLHAAEMDQDTAAVQRWRNDSLFAAKRAYEVFVKQLERDYTAYHALKYKKEIVSLSALQQSLPAKTLLLEIALGRPEDSLLYLLTVRHDGSTLHTVPANLPELEQQIVQLNNLLQSPTVARSPRREAFAQLAHQLYQMLLAPVEPQLQDIERLIVCGEGPLHYLPFEVLLRDSTDRPVQSLDFLVKRFAVSYHYSGTLFSQIRQSPRKKIAYQSELLTFAPVFAQGPKAGEWIQGDTSLRALDADGRWTPLPYSEKEAQNIAQLFKAKRPGSATTLIRQQATEKSLKQALEKGHRFVHIASHSFANVEAPKFSGIACHAPDSNAAVLYTAEIYNLAVKAELVVLSSCESGLGRLVRGEGLLGLNRAFLYAGVPNVVYSLWKVNDRATADLMTSFYRALLEGKPYADALRAAKLDMLRNPATASPNFWSGFVGVLSQ